MGVQQHLRSCVGRKGHVDCTVLEQGVLEREADQVRHVADGRGPLKLSISVNWHDDRPHLRLPWATGLPNEDRPGPRDYDS